MTNKKELFLTWTKNLFYLQCAALVGTVLAALPFVGTWIGWINNIISVGILFAIYKLVPVNARYRKAAIFLGIAIVLGFIIRFTEIGILILVAPICSWIATYQEYNGHSEMMAGVDEKLSRNWHSLFNWNLWGGLLVGMFGGIITVIAGVAFISDPNVIAAIVVLIVGAFDTIIMIFYLLFLKRTHAAYEKYEPKIEEEISVENMI